MKNTTDIWFASFLMLQGYNVSDFDIISRGKGRYYFSLTEDEWKSQKLDFNASTISRIKNNQQALKDLLY